MTRRPVTSTSSAARTPAVVGARYLPRVLGLPVGLLVGLAGVSRADIPAIMQSAPTAATGPTAGAAQTPTTGTDADLLVDIAGVFVPPAQAEKLTKISPADRAKLVGEIWDGLQPHEKAAIRYASEHFRENASLLTSRTITLLALGPPLRIHEEPTHAWAGETAPVFSSPLDLIHVLVPDPKKPAAAPASTVTLTGPLPTQAWIYAGKTVNEQKVVWFADEASDGAGTWRYVKTDESVPVATVVSTAPATEMPAELFPPTGAGETFKPLPQLLQAGLPITVSADFFKASTGKTFCRIMGVIDPTDVDLELSGDAKAFQADATLWLQVDKDGAPQHQAQAPLAGVGPGEPWLAEFGVPLLPGQYQVTMLAVDKQGKGGKKVATIDVPAFGEGMSLSSAVAAKAQKLGAETGLPKAPASADGSLAAFQIGNYVVRPQVPATFKRGDTLVIVVQAYGPSKAELDYDLWREGTFQNSLPIELDRLPVTDIEQFEITADWTDGAYEMRISLVDPTKPKDAKAGKDAGTPAARTVSFRVKG